MNKEDINIRKQNNAIVPNIVHSFDASNIALLIKSITSSYTDNSMNLLTIHDCFATNANDVEKMEFLVKWAFMNLYLDKSFIDNYHDFILDYLIKIGFKIDEKYSESKKKIKKYVEVNTKNNLGEIELIKHRIPDNPKFESNKNLILEVSNSEYFMN